MKFEFLGILFNITIGIVIVSLVITINIVVIHQIYLSIRFLKPFKKDPQANESLFFIHSIGQYYFSRFQVFSVKNREEFSQKLNQLRTVLDYRHLQEKSYRIHFQGILHQYHSDLEKAYNQFCALSIQTEISRSDVEVTVKNVLQVLNKLIIAINEEFEGELGE